jgi:hypothetical protein
MIFVRSHVVAAQLTPQENQYIEFRVVSVEKVEGKDKQVIAELWAYNMEFTAIDLNLYYDNTKLRPSDIETNEYIEQEDAQDGNMFWKTEKFTEDLDIWFMQYMPDWLQYIFSILFSETSQNQHIYTGTNQNGEEYISTKAGEEGVFLGRFSYRLFNGKIDETTFGLKSTSEQPTGIQVIIDNVDEYVDPNIFKVSLRHKSDNANLLDIKIDDESIPGFDKNIQAYEKEILEQKEKVNITVTKEEETATVKVKKEIPDPENVGQVIYEEIPIDEENNQYIVDLNQIGEDTKIKIEVTAEDEETVKTYELTIKRPCGKIVGSIETINIEGIHIAQVKIYKKDQIDWDNLYGHEELDQIQTVNTIQTNEDGTYEIKLIPGEYELLIDKPGYLDYIVKNLKVEKDSTIELEHEILIPGDVDKSGLVSFEDLTFVNIWYGAEKDISEDYTENADFEQKGYVGFEDVTWINQNYEKERKIIIYEE